MLLRTYTTPWGTILNGTAQSEASLKKEPVRFLGQKIGDHVWITIAVLVFVWTGLVVERLNDRAALFNGAIDKANSFAISFEGQISLSLNSFDQIMLSARMPDGRLPDSFLVEHLIKTSALREAIFSMSVYNQVGDLVFTTATDVPSKVNVADRPWFAAFRDGGKDSIYISQPIDSRVSRKLSIVLARGI